MNFTHKLVAVINKNLEQGVALNALAHMTLGLGARVEVQALRLDTYQDADGNTYPGISQMPFIVLRGTSGEIRKLVAQVREQSDCTLGVFFNTMTGGTYAEQLSTTEATSEADLIYYGCVMFGPWDTVSQLTKKLSLWR